MRARTAVAALLALPLISACGDRTSGPDAPRAAGGWRTEHLEGAASPDFPTRLVTDGDDALVVMLSDEGILQSHFSRDGAAFETGEPLDLGEPYAALGDVVRLPDGSWYALGTAGPDKVDGDSELAYEPFAVRSDDGLSWQRVEVAGFDDAVEVEGLEAVGGRIVAVGAYRTRAAEGGFEAQVWTSADGRSFREADLPGVPVYHGYDDESYAADVATVDGDLLVAGKVGGRGALWRSDDGGSTWADIDTPALRGTSSAPALEAVGSTVVAGVSGQVEKVQAIRSEDGGRTWDPVAALPVSGEADGWAPLWSGAGRFFTLTGVDDQSWSRPEVCYADLDQCGKNPPPRVMTSGDGRSWSAVDLPGEVDEVAGTSDGRVLVLTGDGGGAGVAVLTWPAGSELPAAEPQAAPETVELVTLPEGAEPEVGVRYHFPLSTHCGIQQIWFGGAVWRRTDDGPRYETGAGDPAPDDWPVPDGGGAVYGYATVRDDGVLAYTTEDGTLLATYERGGEPFECD